MDIETPWAGRCWIEDAGRPGSRRCQSQCASCSGVKAPWQGSCFIEDAQPGRPRCAEPCAECGPLDPEQASLAHRPGRPGPHDMETFTGRYVNVIDPDPADIVIEDVAHHLANICRYTGACRRNYSVGEHAVLVARKLEEMGAPIPVILAGLHHDDSEAYLNDQGRPLKQNLREYRRFEARMDVVVRDVLGISQLPFDDPRIKQADTWALGAESFQLLPSRGKRWISDGYYVPGGPDDRWLWALGWHLEVTKDRWMSWHTNLGGGGA